MCPALTPSIGQKKITVKSETLESFKINIALIDQNTVHLSFKTFFLENVALFIEQKSPCSLLSVDFGTDP